MDHNERIERLTLAVSRPMILDHYGPASCAVSGRVVLDVLAHFGVPARPLAAWARVLNRPFAEALEAGSTPSAESGAWSVDIGNPESGGRHMVVVTDHALLDPSLDQASRPERGIEIPPSRFPLPESARRDLLAGDTAWFRFEDGGLAVGYTGMPSNAWYSASPNWGRRDGALRRRIAGSTIRIVREALSKTA